MEKLKGTLLRKDLPSGFTLSPSDARQLCFNSIDLMVELHQVDVGSAGLADLGKGEGYTVRQIDGWARRIEKAAIDDLPDFMPIVNWLRTNNPAKTGLVGV
jgi:aminoglycoside phosphotransferase (APT) family kinase protein